MEQKKGRLSNIVSMDSSEDNLEDRLFDDSIIIDKGFYLEIYINPDGVHAGEENSNGYSFFRKIGADMSLAHLLKKPEFVEGSFRKGTMAINVIPNEDPLFESERELCSVLF